MQLTSTPNEWSPQKRPSARLVAELLRKWPSTNTDDRLVLFGSRKPRLRCKQSPSCHPACSFLHDRISRDSPPALDPKYSTAKWGLGVARTGHGSCTPYSSYANWLCREFRRELGSPTHTSGESISVSWLGYGWRGTLTLEIPATVKRRKRLSLFNTFELFEASSWSIIVGFWILKSGPVKATLAAFTWSGQFVRQIISPQMRSTSQRWRILKWRIAISFIKNQLEFEKYTEEPTVERFESCCRRNVIPTEKPSVFNRRSREHPIIIYLSKRLSLCYSIAWWRGVAGESIQISVTKFE